MDSVPQFLRRTATVLVLLAAASCSAAPAGVPPTPAAIAGPLTVEINQFRDNYSKQIVEIQLTNTTDRVVTVLAAVVQSPLFESGISWTSPGEGVEVPPGQAKSLPAQLPAAYCPGLQPPASQPPASQPPASQPLPGQTTAGQPAEDAASVRIRLAPDGGAGGPLTAAAADPFGVLARNQAELCVAQAAAGVADFRFSPELEVAPDGHTAVLRLDITPRNAAGAVDGVGGNLTIDSIGGTTLLEEDAGAPWPTGLRVDAAGPEHALRLGIRPARCDPHAVAEDKVGTLIPLRVTVAGREGVLKVDTGAQLRGRIYGFVTSACGRQ